MRAINLNSFWLKQVLFVVAIFFFSKSIYAQPGLPQRTISVTATQAIHFGSFCITGGAGGTVTLSYDGSRTSTGDIVLLSSAPFHQPAIFEVTLCEGRNVIITYDATSTLTDGIGLLTMDIGPTEKGISGSSFETNNDCNFLTTLRVGGTLHIPGTALPGIYTGNFAITFNQE